MEFLTARASLALLCVCVCSWAVGAFHVPSAVPILVTSNGFELSTDMRQLAERKIGSVLQKLGRETYSAHVVFKGNKFRALETHALMSKKGSQKTEVTVHLGDKTIIHATQRSDDPWIGIDLLSHKLSKLILKHRRRLTERTHTHKNHKGMGLNSIETESADENTEFEASAEDIEPRPAIIKEKRLPLTSISLNKAREQFELIDHPFYVFRDKESDDICILYKRDDGDLGLIVPTRQQSH